MATTTPWKPVVEAALASRHADCGHALSHKSNALVWLRTEKVGGVVEVWSVCHGCHVEGQDYEYLAGSDKAPTRTREETL